jgi:hypothetical protein
MSTRAAAATCCAPYVLLNVGRGRAQHFDLCDCVFNLLTRFQSRSGEVYLQAPSYDVQMWDLSHDSLSQLLAAHPYLLLHCSGNLKVGWKIELCLMLETQEGL